MSVYLLAGGELTYYALVCAFTTLPTRTGNVEKFAQVVVLRHCLLLSFKHTDDQRNGLDCLETWAKAVMFLKGHPWYGLIRYTLEPCNFPELCTTKLRTNTKCFAIFDMRNISSNIACWLCKIYQNNVSWFSALFTRWASTSSLEGCVFSGQNIGQTRSNDEIWARHQTTIFTFASQNDEVLLIFLSNHVKHAQTGACV